MEKLREWDEIKAAEQAEKEADQKVSEILKNLAIGQILIDLGLSGLAYDAYTRGSDMMPPVMEPELAQAFINTYFQKLNGAPKLKAKTCTPKLYSARR